MKNREKSDEGLVYRLKPRLSIRLATEPPELLPGSAVMHWSFPLREVRGSRGRWDVPRKEGDGAAASPPTLAEAPR